MKKFLAVSLLSAAILAPVVAHAAPVELKLIGTITPAACAPTFTGGDTIDYGNIPAGSLNATAQTMLPAKTTSLTILCDAPTVFYISSADERAGTLVSTLETIPGYTAAMKFGLGASGGTNIGAYSLQMGPATPDTGTANRLISDDNGVSWAVFGGGIRADGSSIIGWNDGTATAPTAHTSIAVDINVVAAVDKTANLPITNDIAIDGLATIEVIYP